jgi:hypothetical protein
VSALAIFVSVAALLAAALGSNRSSPADQSPGIPVNSGGIVVRSIVGDRLGAILQIDPVTSEEHALPVVAPANDLVWPTKDPTDLSSSPDGSALAYVWSSDVWILDIATGRSTKIVDNCGEGCLVAWSPDGTVIAIAHSGTLELVSPTGNDRRIVTTSSGFTSVAWSPDSQQLVVTSDGHLFTIQRGHSDLRPLGVNAWAAAWSPDGSRIAYLSPKDCNDHGCVLVVGMVRSDGADAAGVITAGRCFCTGFWPGLAWSPDGTQMALVIPGPNGQPSGLYIMDEDGSGLRLVREGAWGPPTWRPES